MSVVISSFDSNIDSDCPLFLEFCCTDCAMFGNIDAIPRQMANIIVSSITDSFVITLNKATNTYYCSSVGFEMCSICACYVEMLCEMFNAKTTQIVSTNGVHYILYAENSFRKRDHDFVHNTTKLLRLTWNNTSWIQINAQ